MADLSVAVRADIGRVMRRLRLGYLPDQASAAGPEPLADALAIARPARCDNEVVVRLVFQQHSRTAVAKRLCNVVRGVLQQGLELERGVGALREALQEQKVFHLLLQRFLDHLGQHDWVAPGPTIGHALDPRLRLLDDASRLSEEGGRLSHT